MDHLLIFAHYALSFVLVLSIIVFIHEFGHYSVAKLCGVRIEAFSIGFGPELAGWRDRSGTRWKISALPLGGYVKMYGDASAASNADFGALAALSVEERRRTFYYKKLWQKALIVAAGPAFNFLLTIGIFTYFILTTGLPSTEPVVGGVMPNSPAASAGLQPGDRITRVGNDVVERFSDIPYLIATNLGTPVEIYFTRGGQANEVTLTPQQTADTDALGNAAMRPLIGIKSLDMHYEKANFPQAVGEATLRTYQLCTATIRVIGQIITGKRSAHELKGAVGIAQLSGQATEKGMSTTFWLIAMISANLGLMNLFPVPVLDGGHLAYFAVEAARGRPMAVKLQEYSMRVGFALVLCLMAFTIVNDVRRLVF